MAFRQYDSGYEVSVRAPGKIQMYRENIWRVYQHYGSLSAILI